MALSPSTRTPQVRASIVFGASGSAPAAAAQSILLIGSKIGEDIDADIATSGSTSTTITTTAGTAPLDRASRVMSPDDAAVKAGRGAELHLAAVDTFAQYRNAEVWIAPVTPGVSAAAASATITPTVSSLAGCTLRITVAGRSVDVGISGSDTVSIIGRKIAAAINNQPDWPVTAANTWSTGATVVTAKVLGPRGNAITLRVAILTATDTVEGASPSAAVTASGLTLTPSGGATDGGVYRLAGGTVDDNVTALLTAIATQKFDRICFAGYRVSGSASANLARIAAQVDTQSDASMFDEQVVFGSIETPGNANTLSQGLNRERCMWVCDPGSDDLPLSIAGQVAAARLFGDAIAGGSVDGEATSPATNLNGLELASLRAPLDPGDLMDGSEIEDALGHGVSPLMASPSRPGGMALVASITTKSMREGVPFFGTYKTKEVTVADAVRAYVVEALRTTYRSFNLVADPPDGTPVLIPKTTWPAQIRERIYGLLKDLEKRGWLTEVRRGEIAVTINASNARRVDFSFPMRAPSDFDIADGTLYQRQPGA